MADAWIKFRKKLCTDGRVIGVAKKCGVSANEVLGGLIRLWSLADDHGGFLSAYDADTLDMLVSIKGFTNALPEDWIVVEKDGLLLPNYEDHNGSTAKRRAKEAARKANARKTSAPVADKKRTRGDKIREEDTTTLSDKSDNSNSRSEKVHAPPGGVKYPDDFEAFWSHYPRRVQKGAALKAWKKLTAKDRLAATERAEWVAGCWAYHDPHGERLQFMPHPATWLNARGWEDDDGAVELAARGK